MKVLLIEDSPRLQASVSRALRKSGYSVDATGDGTEGLWFARENDYDAIVLDLMLPGTDGLTLLRKLRAAGKTTHVLILTAKDTVDDRVRGLQGGADDYLVKPFALEELLARVQALCRRGYGSKSACVIVGDIELNTAARRVTANGATIDLAAREYRLLEYLALRHGEPASRSEIEAHIYDSEVEPMSNVVDSAISVLRKKLGPAQSHIRTRRGLGYVLEAPE